LLFLSVHLSLICSFFSFDFLFLSCTPIGAPLEAHQGDATAAPRLGRRLLTHGLGNSNLADFDQTVVNTTRIVLMSLFT
jgi:hypothetical protein